MSSTANSVGARAVENIMHGYSNLAALEKTPPVVISGGRGVYVIDEDGKEYIEGAAGMWCASFGFNENELVEAAIRQFRKLPYYHSLIDKTTEPMTELAERLTAMAPGPMAKVFFANSGSEANDTAVKMIYYYNNAIARPEKKKIISRLFGFHGVTLAAASITGIPAMHVGFDLPLPNFKHTDCAVWDIDGKSLIVRDVGTDLLKIDAQTGAVLLRMTGHAGPILAMHQDASGRRLVSGGSSGQLRIWDLRSGASREITGNLGQPVVDVRIDASAGTVAARLQSGRLRGTPDHRGHSVSGAPQIVE